MISANGIQRDYMRPVIDRAEELFASVAINPWGRRPTQAELLEAWDGVDAVVCGAELIDGEMLAKAPKSLRVLSRYGVGCDSIDCAAAARRGITVCNTPGANTVSVADLAMGLILCAVRQIPYHDLHTRRGEWRRFYPTCELEGKTLGIIGFGTIGKQVARRAFGFGMDIQANDVCFDQEAAALYHVKEVSLDEFLATSDVVSLHAPGSPETYHLINADTLRKMKRGAYLVNTARGSLIDEEALYEALTSGQLTGAGLDVYSREPIKESPLFELENVVLTPHQGAATVEASRNMGRMAVENAYAVLNGLPCKYIVNFRAGIET